MLAEVNALSSGVATLRASWPNSPRRRCHQEWDFAALLDAYMRRQGDDPSAFIRPAVDWFHMNAVTYDPRDDSLIVSSRENFVIKVDYALGRDLILGDPSKYWYTFRSLKARATAPGTWRALTHRQHAPQLLPMGCSWLFNDGGASFNQPAGAPVGESRAYSAVSAYAIDPATLTAREVWRFDYGRPFCLTYAPVHTSHRVVVARYLFGR